MSTSTSEGFGNFTAYPAANWFPMLGESELGDLAADIEEHGQREPIVVWGNRLVDGRNRMRACELAGVEPEIRFEDFADDGACVEYIVSKNVRRRHLTTSERSMVAGRMKDHFQAAAKQRQRDSGGSEPVPRNCEEPLGEWSDEAGRALNVSGDSVRRAAEVLEHGTPSLQQSVERGEVSVSAAADIAKETSPKRQDELVAHGQKELRSQAKRIRHARREARKRERLAKKSNGATGAPEFPEGTFPVIYADPPWHFEDPEPTNREVESLYPTMDLNAIRALDVAALATPDAVLFLWANNSTLDDALRVVKAWGFRYRANLAWVKPSIGAGGYFGEQHELLLFAVRGTPPTPPSSSLHSSVLESPCREQSRKPDEVYDIIEGMYPDTPRIELFACRHREGWDVWGKEIAKDDVVPAASGEARP